MAGLGLHAIDFDCPTCLAEVKARCVAGRHPCKARVLLAMQMTRKLNLLAKAKSEK